MDDKVKMNDGLIEGLEQQLIIREQDDHASL